jgi:hypothetical protein
MKKSTYYLPVLIGLLIFTTFTSCNKDEEIDAQAVEDNAKGSLVVSDAFAFSNSTASGKKLAGTECYTTVTIDNGFELTFDSCIYDGILRNGKIILTLSQDWSEGSLMSIEFQDFVFDGNRIDGKITAGYRIDITRLDILNGIYFEIKAIDMVMDFNDGTSFSWNSTMNFGLRIDGVLPVFEYYGFSYGTNRLGEEFETNSEAVLFDRACVWPSSGTFTMKVGNKETVVDFDEDGTGICNNVIKVTCGDNTLNLTLEPNN